MKWRGFRQNQRSVSEIYGTLLIISLSFITALLLIGGGWVIVDQIQSEAQDSLAQDNIENIDQGINDLAGATENETKTFQIPEDTGEDYKANANEGVFVINITANDTYWNRTEAYARGWDKTNETKIVLGTIEHEAEDGTVTAFQGGGLWRQAPNSDAVFIESAPRLGYTEDSRGGNLNLGIVNLTDAEAITEGSEITARKNRSSEAAEEIKQFIAKYYTDRYDGSTTLPVDITIEIQSEYASGWEKHATERMNFSSSRITTPADTEVEIDIPELGAGVNAPRNPTFGDEDILYSGASDWAYMYQNDTAADGSLRDTPMDGPWPNQPTVNESDPDFGGSISDGDYEIAVYNESGRWLIYNNSIGSWQTHDYQNVNISAGNEPFNMSQHDNATNFPGDHEFHIDSPMRLNNTGAAPICIVTNTSDDADVRQHLREGGSGTPACLENMVGIDNDLVEPIPTYPEFNVTVDRDGPATQIEYTEGDDFPLEVTVENEGTGNGTRPLGVYLINESNFYDGNFTKSYLANSTRAENLRLNKSESRTIQYTIELKKEWRLADGPPGEEWIVFATTGTDTSVLNESAGSDVPDTFEINPVQSDFQIESDTDITVPADSGEELKQGEAVTVEVTVNDTEQERDESESQIVTLERDGRVLNQTRVTIGTDADYSGDWEETVEMTWYIDQDAPSNVTLEASTYDMGSPQTKDVSVEQTEEDSPAFDVYDLEIRDGVAAGETVEIDAPVENVGSAAGEELVLLKDRDTGDTLAYEQVQRDAGEEQPVTIEWETEESDYKDGEPYSVEVVVDDNSSQGEIELQDPSTTPNFEITITGTNSPVEVGNGNTLDVDVEINNTGDGTGSQWVYLDAENFGGAEDGYTYVEDLAPGDDPVTKTLSWEPNPDTTATDNIIAKTKDDSDRQEATVELPSDARPDFTVEFKKDESNSWNSTENRYRTSAGDTLTVEATVGNAGNERGWQYVYLTDFEGNTITQKNVTLDPEETKNVTLTWETSGADQGEGPLNVFTNDDDDEQDGAVLLNQPESDFTVSFDDDPYSVIAGNDRDVRVTVTNDGDETDRQVIYLEDPSGDLVDTVQTSELESSESETVTLWWNTTVADGDEFGQNEILTAGSDDDTATAEIDVSEANVDRSDFQVEITGTNSPIVEGENLTVTAEITNVDDVADEQDIVLENFRGGPVDATEVSLDGQDGNNTATVEFTWQTVVGTIEGLDSDTDEVTDAITVRSEDSDANESVTIEKKEVLRDPVDVMFAIDETGSMGTYDYADDYYDDDSDMPVTVDEGEVWVLEDEACSDNCQATDYDESEWFVPGETITEEDFDESTYEYLSRFEVDADSSYCNRFGCFDPYGDRIKAAKAALSGLNESLGDQAGALEFTTDANVYQDLSNNLTQVNESLRISPGGGTDIAAGIEEAEDALLDGEPEHKPVMIVLTDGEDNDGDDPVEVAEDVDEEIPIYTVGFGGADTDTLQEISDGGSGEGEQYFASDTDELEGIFDDIIANVTEPDTPDFQIDSTSLSEDPVEASDPLTVTTTITNEGEVGGEQFVSLQAADAVVDSTRVNLSKGETQSVDLVWDTTGADPGSTDLVIRTLNDRENRTVTVTERESDPAEFEVTIQDESDLPEEINVSEEIAVTAKITNTKDTQATQEIGLYIDDTNFSGSSETVSLGADEETTVTLSWTPDATDGGERQLVVKSEQDSDNTSVVVKDGSNEPDFLVDIGETNDPVTAGEELTVNVTVENDGDRDSEQTVYLFDDEAESIVDFRDVQLAGSGPDATKRVQLSWQTELGDENTTLRAQTSADQETVDVTVTQQESSQPEFDITINESDTVTVTEGEFVSLEVIVKNEEETNSTQGINLFEGDALLNTTELSLGPLEQETVWLGFQTEPGDGGTQKQLEVRSAQDEDDVTVDIERDTADSEYTVDIYEDEIPAEVAVGEELEVKANVTNDGTEQDGQNIVLEDSDPIDVKQNLELEPGESNNVTLTWTPDQQASNKELTVRSRDDNQSFQIDVTSSSTAYEVEIVDGPDYTSPATAGDTVAVEVELETNESVQANDELVWLNVTQDGNTTYQSYKQVDIGPDETKSVTLKWNSSERDVGEYKLDVKTNDDEELDNDLTLDPPQLFDISFGSVNTPITAGEKLEVNVTIENTGDVERSPALQLNYTKSNFIVDMTNVDEIPSGGEKTVTLTWDTVPGVGDENEQTIRAQLPNYGEFEEKDVQIDEAESDLDRASRAEQRNPLDIDLSEIEIGS